MAPRTTAAWARLDATPRPVVAAAVDYPHGHVVAWHRHRRCQLVYAVAGVMTVATEGGLWVVPPLRAVWVPGGVAHRIEMSGAVALRSLYVEPGARPGLPDESCVVAVPPLLRELILHAITLPRRYDEAGPEGRVMAVILDQLDALPVLPLHLPLPRDRRLARITAALIADPADRRRLQDWSRTVGASSRTLARLFRAELGLTFRGWRQHLRVLEALKRLARGEPVTRVAGEVGFDSQSAFIAMFKRQLGETPGRYFAQAGRRPPVLSDSR